MGEALTKEELDAVVSGWKRWREEMGVPVVPADNSSSLLPLTKAVPAMRDAELINAIAKGFAPAIAEAIEAAVSPLRARIEELERKGYVGVWKSGKEYSPQSECTHDGARWISHKRTSDKPGASGDWTMIEKSAPAPTANPRNGSALSAAQPRL